MEGILHTYGTNDSHIVLNVNERIKESTIVTLIIPDNRTVELSLEEAIVIKHLLNSCNKI